MRNGFTLVEVMVAIAIIALVTFNLLDMKKDVLREASKTRDIRLGWLLASQKMGELSLSKDLFQGALVYTYSGSFKDKNGNDIYPDFKYELEVTTDNIVVNTTDKDAQLAHVKLKVEPASTKSEKDYIKLEAFYPVVLPGDK